MMTINIYKTWGAGDSVTFSTPDLGLVTAELLNWKGPCRSPRREDAFDLRRQSKLQYNRDQGVISFSAEKEKKKN